MICSAVNRKRSSKSPFYALMLMAGASLIASSAMAATKASRISAKDILAKLRESSAGSSIYLGTENRNVSIKFARGAS